MSHISQRGQPGALRKGLASIVVPVLGLWDALLFQIISLFVLLGRFEMWIRSFASY